jgi:tripeptide aminopeptidase
MINKRRLITTFKELVRIDSLSLREAKVAGYVRRELKRIGIRSVQAGRPVGGDSGSLVAFLPGRGPVILLNAHLDTVSPGRNIRPVEKNGLIRAGGQTVLGADNKAGVAAILEILRTLKEKRLEHPPLQIIFTVAEEIGIVGAKALPANVLKADFGYALDGGAVNKVLNAAPTQYNLTARIVGRAAHAGVHPEEGINAIRVASEAIAKMRLGRIDRETTANIGIIRGGKATNIIPDEVEIRGEARSHDPRKLRRQVAEMEKTLRAACRRHHAKLQLRVEKMYGSFAVGRESAVMKMAVAGLKRTKIKPVVKPSGGGSDANVFNARGVPTLVLGLGAHNLHTNRETLKIADFIKGTEMVLNIVLGARHG